MPEIKRKMKPHQVFRVVADDEESYLAGRVLNGKGIQHDGCRVSDQAEGVVIIADENGDLEYHENSLEERAVALEYLNA